MVNGIKTRRRIGLASARGATERVLILELEEKQML